MSLWSRLNQISEEMASRSAASSVNVVDARVTKAAKATQNWKKVLGKVMNLIVAFEQVVKGCPEEGEGWQEGGSQRGYAASYAAMERPPPLPEFRRPLSKQEMYAEAIKTGIPLVPRKMTKPPTTSTAVCTHPTQSLCGAGNQWQREVWCQECYSRWKIETMSQPTSKKESARKQKTEPSTPPRETSSWSAISPVRSMPSTPSMSTVSESPGRPEQVPMKCQCGKPATRYTVRKEGPTKGRHFYRCSAKICDYFMWDQEEIQQIKMGVTSLPMKGNHQEMSESVVEMRRKEAELRMREEAMLEELRKKETELQEMHAHMSENTKQLIETTMQHADTKHRELMQGQFYQHQVQMEQLQNQLMWTMAVAGEERLSQAFSDPERNAWFNKQWQ